MCLQAWIRLKPLCLPGQDGCPMTSDQARGAGRAAMLANAHTAVRAQVLAGSVVAQGEAEAVITATGGCTFFGKTVALLSEPEEVGHLHKVLLSFPPLLLCSARSAEARDRRCTRTCAGDSVEMQPGQLTAGPHVKQGS